MKKQELQELLSNESKPITQDEFDRFTKTQHLLLTGVIIVLFLGFISLVISSASPIIEAIWFKAGKYQDLTDKINGQSLMIENLTKELNEKGNKQTDSATQTDKQICPTGNKK